MSHLFSLDHTSIPLRCGVYSYPDEEEEEGESSQEEEDELSVASKIKLPFIHTYNQERTSLRKGPYWFIQQYNALHVYSIGEGYFFIGRDDDAGELVATYEFTRGIDSFRCTEWLPQVLCDCIETLIKNDEKYSLEFKEEKERALSPFNQFKSPLGIRGAPSKQDMSTLFYLPEYELSKTSQNLLLYSHETMTLMTLRLEPDLKYPLELFKLSLDIPLTYPSCVLIENIEGLYIPIENNETSENSDYNGIREEEKKYFSKNSILLLLFGGSKENVWDTLYLVDIGNYPMSVSSMNISFVSQNKILQRRETQAIRRNSQKIIYGFGSQYRPTPQDPDIRYNDLWELNLRTWEWTEIGQFGAEKPSIRSGQSMVMHPTEDLLIISGGYNPDKGYVNDVWILNLRTNHWLIVIPNVMDNLTIDTMGYHSSIICGNHLWTCNVDEMLHFYLPEFGIHPTQALLKKNQMVGNYCDCIVTFR